MSASRAVSPAVHDVDSAAAALLRAERDRAPRGRITAEWEGLDLVTAYRVQRALVDAKVVRGERVIGIKLGLTSQAKQQRMGIDSPLTAVLTDTHLLGDGEAVPMGELIHPRVEPEIAFVLAERLAGPGVTAASALAAVDHVRAGLEVIDSRYRDYDFALPDVVADNASAARFVLGDRRIAPGDLDLAAEEVFLSVQGEVIDRATGSAVQGHPAEALALAANALAERGESIEAGAIVLTGGMTDAVTLRSGQRVGAEYTTLGTIDVVGA